LRLFSLISATAVTIASVVLGAIVAIFSSITVGLIVKDWTKNKHKFKKQLLPNWKSKIEIVNEIKLQTEKQKIEVKMQKELFLSLTDDQKQERILNAFC